MPTTHQQALEKGTKLRFLRKERETLENLLPGLDSKLAEVPLMELEHPDSIGLSLFCEAGGPGLLVPTEHHGLGSTALAAVRVQRAIGARSPSLAVATTMHNFSIASLVELSKNSRGFEWMLLEGIALDSRLVASGFAEGHPGQGILKPTMVARPCVGGFTISGAKKPCSLSRSMDLLTASVALPSSSGQGTELAVALIPAAEEGVEVKPFWNTWVLAGAESDEVLLHDVKVPDDLVIRTEIGAGDELDKLQSIGLLWFELLLTASYLGAASALAERVLEDGRGEVAEQASIGIELESAMDMLEGTCLAMMMHEDVSGLLAQALIARYAINGAIGRAVQSAVQLLGGMAFIGSSDVAYLSAATQALAFHPPSSSKMAAPLVEFFQGHPLRIV